MSEIVYLCVLRPYCRVKSVNTPYTLYSNGRIDKILPCFLTGGSERNALILAARLICTIVQSTPWHMFETYYTVVVESTE
jgi:hypothetical protein